MSVMILILWNENYGDASAKALHSFTDAMNTIRQGMNLLTIDWWYFIDVKKQYNCWNMYSMSLCIDPEFIEWVSDMDWV